MDHDYGPPLWSPLPPSLHRDPPPLRYLTLQSRVLGCCFVDFVSRLSRLEYLNIQFCTMEAEFMANIPGDDFPTITLSLLRSLIVNRIDYDIVRLLSFLDVPSLEHLTMDMDRSYEANTILWKSVHNFLQGNPPSLRHLTLRYMVLGCSFVDIL